MFKILKHHKNSRDPGTHESDRGLLCYFTLGTLWCTDLVLGLGPRQRDWWSRVNLITQIIHALTCQSLNYCIVHLQLTNTIITGMSAGWGVSTEYFPHLIQSKVKVILNLKVKWIEHKCFIMKRSQRLRFCNVGWVVESCNFLFLPPWHLSSYSYC